MKQNYRRVSVVVVILGLLLSACARGPEATTAKEERPITIEHLQGKDPTRETLTEAAVKRLDIQTAAVRDADSYGTQQKVVPYSAILYDTQGDTWVYTSPAPLTFLRNPVKVDYIDGDQAFLSDGPPAGSAVVTVGAEELYGAEFEFQEE